MKVNRYIFIFLLFALLVGCAPPADVTEEPAAPTEAAETTEDESESAITVTDGLGRELTFDEPPERVVTYYNGAYGMMATIGVKPVAQAVNPSMLTNPIYFDGTGEDIPTISFEDGPNLEEVAAAEPDLVIVYTEEEIAALEGIAPAFAQFRVENIEDVYAAVSEYGVLFDREAEAQEAITNFQDRLAAYQSLAPGDASIAVAGPDGDLNTVWIRTEASPDCQLLNEVADCSWEDPTGGDSWSYETTPETLLELNPDFIYYWDEWDGTIAELYDHVEGNALWAELDAVQNGRLLYEEGYSNPIASSLPAATKLLDTFAPMLYPDVFDGPLAEDEIEAILSSEGMGDTTEDAAFPRTIVDAAGREVTFDAPPERIVTYYNNSYGMLATFDVMPVAQSVNPEMLTDPIYFNGEGSDIPRISTEDGHDLEEVAAAQPDLVFVFSQEEADALEGIAPAFVTPSPTTIDELYDAVRVYGSVLGMEAEAEEAVGTFEQRFEAYQSVVPGDVSVLKLGAMNDGAFWISTLDDPICQALNAVAACEWESPTETEFWGYEGTSEAVLALDPDIIILNNWSNSSDEELNQQLADDPLWQELRAVQNDRVISTPDYTNPIASSLPALQKFLDVYMPLIYPDTLDGPLTDEEIQDILGQ